MKNPIISKLNTKLMLSCFTGCLVYFTDDDIYEISEEEAANLGCHAVCDGTNLIDFIENVMDDISNVYGIDKRNDKPYNLADFYSENGFYDANCSVEQDLKLLDIFKDRPINT